MGEVNASWNLIRKPERKNSLRDLSIDVQVMLNWILNQ